jgi:osmotically-inducible protein OsmY
MSTVNEEVGDKVLRAVQLTLGVFAQRITVRVEGGRVLLYGDAYSLEERAHLETLALSVPGVSTVENYLCVNLFA